MCTLRLEELRHLVFYSAQGIINGFCVGMELVGHLLVRESVNIQAEYSVLEVAQGLLDMLVGVLEVFLVDE